MSRPNSAGTATGLEQQYRLVATPDLQEYLSGKVRKRVLPVFEGPPPAGVPTVKRLLLPQGELAQFYDGEQPMRYLAFIELRAGSTRGNHYHKHKQEFIYLLSGELLLIVEDVASKARMNVPLRTGELVSVATGVAHTLQVTKSGQAVEFSPARFDPADTFRYPLDTPA